MASIFTYDPDPPRVSSPWLCATDVPNGTSVADHLDTSSTVPQAQFPNTPKPQVLSDLGITKLEAEPQVGPTEYKLHLLLRPRKGPTTSDMVDTALESHQSDPILANSQSGERSSKSPPVNLASSNQPRQQRLQQLTTQLLWRLQQSSPYHSSSSTPAPLVDNTPEEGNVSKNNAVSLPGLEESQGALYEIGVSDDGTLVGLTKDEMDESIDTLRSMAATLGCSLQLLRIVEVGECKWSQKSVASTFNDSGDIQKEKLWVAEALVVPELQNSRPSYEILREPCLGLRRVSPGDEFLSKGESDCTDRGPSTEQLRVSLTGPTMSGKSSLLGTLSTATLDNGRGKSRLSLLKHRHEIESGVTSSVSQELIGYQLQTTGEDGQGDMNLINYAAGNVSTWNDIHSSCRDGRLVFLSDSAGHHRYRRTTVRGIVGWAPHWTILCIPAAESTTSSGLTTSNPPSRDTVPGVGCDINPSDAHLELCLKLNLPLVIVITKLDLATKSGLRSILAGVLSKLKAVGRQPAMMSITETGGFDPMDLKHLLEEDRRDAKRVVAIIDKSNHPSVVPVVLTSALKGNGVGKLHALLSQLPIPSPSYNNTTLQAGNATNMLPSVLYHIEDIWSMPPVGMPNSRDSNGKTVTNCFIVSGHLRYGRISLSDALIVGPFYGDHDDFDAIQNLRARTPPTGNPREQSFGNSTRATSQGVKGSLRYSNRPSIGSTHWRQARVMSIRNLRLPIRELFPGQVGTIGISISSTASPDILEASFDTLQIASSMSNSASPLLSTTFPSSNPRIRKGMILAHFGSPYSRDSPLPPAYTGFIGTFSTSDMNSILPGSLVIVYIASIRAAARVYSHDPVDNSVASTSQGGEDYGDVFGFDEGETGAPSQNLGVSSRGLTSVINLEFRFVASREWVEDGVQVLVMPAGGGEGNLGGLEGCVGTVKEGLT